MTTSTDQRTILVAGIVDDNYDVSTSFAAGLLRFQQKLSVTPSAPHVIFEFFGRVDDALAHAERVLSGTTQPRVVVVDACMGIDADFLLSASFPQDAITIASYPLRELRWDTVHTTPTGKERYPDDILTYNFEKHMIQTTPSDACTVTDDSRILMPCSHVVQAKIVSIPLPLIPKFRRQYDRVTHNLLCSNDMIDVTAECINAGPYDFSGCVATHLLTEDQLRQTTV